MKEKSHCYLFRRPKFGNPENDSKKSSGWFNTACCLYILHPVYCHMKKVSGLVNLPYSKFNNLFLFRHLHFQSCDIWDQVIHSTDDITSSEYFHQFSTTTFLSVVIGSSLTPYDCSSRVWLIVAMSTFLWLDLCSMQSQLSVFSFYSFADLNFVSPFP